MTRASLLKRASDGKPGPWGDLALTLPVFLVYQLGVVFLDVQNATDLVTRRLIELASGDRLMYLALTAVIGAAIVAVFALLGRGQQLRARKIVQIAMEGAVYALIMGVATSWVVGKLFASLSAPAVQGPFAALVLSLGAGFYEELAFRVALYGLGARVLVWLLVRASDGASAGLVRVGWALFCAGTFSAMHYVGSLGDPFEIRSFAARTVLGISLTLIYVFRGFAAAVWTHALYDAWVLLV